MTQQRSTNSTRFVVDLGNLELPPIIERQIESGIRNVVLQALTNPEVGVARKLDPAIFKGFPGETLGLWIDPDLPEEGSWEGTVPAGGGAPFVGNNVAVLPSSLPTTKAAGIESIRISRVKGGDLHLEQLGTRGQSIKGFALHPIVSDDDKKTVRAVAITEIGSREVKERLGKEERAALGVIVDELTQIRDSTPPEVATYFWHSLFEAIDAGIACGLAGVELGANPIADAGCAVAAGLMVSNDDDDDAPEPVD